MPLLTDEGPLLHPLWLSTHTVDDRRCRERQIFGYCVLIRFEEHGESQLLFTTDNREDPIALELYFFSVYTEVGKCLTGR